MEIEIHPWNWYAPPKSRTLIIGTFPPTGRNWKYDFFYPNTANFFWRLMAAIAETELEYFSGKEAVEERKNILKKLHVAITDMGGVISRNNNSSLDENLEIVEFMDIFKILDENPTIERLVFTSSSKPVSAAVWFLQYLKTKNILHKFPSGKKPLRSELVYKGRKIPITIAYSPSPRCANRISFEDLTALYRNEILGSATA